jgi:hypothetical protein
LLDNLNNNDEELIEHNNKQRKKLLFDNMLGSSAIANEHQVKLMRMQTRSCCGRFKNAYNTVIATLTPFHGDMNLLFYRYDREVQVYFETIRYLIVIAFTVMVIFLYFLITHALGTNFASGEAFWCKYNIPCFLLYSSIQVKERQIYSYSYAAVICVIFFLGLARYINFRRLNLNSKLYDRDHSRFSQFFFTSWDWSTKTKPTYIDKKSRLRKLYLLGMKESEIKDIGFDCNRKCGHYAIRILSIFLTTICMIVYGGLILFAFFIKNFLKTLGGYKASADIIDTIVSL